VIPGESEANQRLISALEKRLAQISRSLEQALEIQRQAAQSRDRRDDS